MEFTPNRGDCLSLIGLARDLNVFYETDINLKTYDKDIPKLDIEFINKSKSIHGDKYDYSKVKYVL